MYHGAMGTGTAGDSGWFEYLFVAAFVCLVVRSLVLERVRSKRIWQFARSAGFAYIGATLPTSFPLRETSVGRAQSIQNVFAGCKGNRELVFFDCRLGTGKSAYSQTVIAIRGSGECFGLPRFDISVTTERVEDWTLMYRPKHVIPAEELEALVSSI
jgi:hypothetical protein